MKAFSELPIPRVYGNAMAVKAEVFPEADPMWSPTGYSCVVQLEQIAEKTAGGIFKTDDQKTHEQFKVVVGKLKRVGPMAFHNRETGREWPGAPWAREGDIVRVRLYTGDRWEQDTDNGKVQFAFFDDLDLRGVKQT